MVVKDQCKLPARNPGSSKQAPPPPPAIGFGNRFQLGQEGNAGSVALCCCLMDFLQAFRMVVLGRF